MVAGVTDIMMVKMAPFLAAVAAEVFITQCIKEVAEEMVKL